MSYLTEQAARTEIGWEERVTYAGGTAPAGSLVPLLPRDGSPSRWQPRYSALVLLMKPQAVGGHLDSDRSSCVSVMYTSKLPTQSNGYFLQDRGSK